MSLLRLSVIRSHSTQLVNVKRQLDWLQVGTCVETDARYKAVCYQLVADDDSDASDGNKNISPP